MSETVETECRRLPEGNCPLSTLGVGCCGKVVSVDGDLELRRRLLEMGLCGGVTIVSKLGGELLLLHVRQDADDPTLIGAGAEIHSMIQTAGLVFHRLFNDVERPRRRQLSRRLFEIKHRKRRLLEIVHALDSTRRLARRLHCREQHSDECADDRDHDQQFDQRETSR